MLLLLFADTYTHTAADAENCFTRRRDSGREAAVERVEYGKGFIPSPAEAMGKCKTIFRAL